MLDAGRRQLTVPIFLGDSHRRDGRSRPAPPTTFPATLSTQLNAMNTKYFRIALLVGLWFPALGAWPRRLGRRRRRGIRTRRDLSRRRSCPTARCRRPTRTGNFIIGPTHKPAPEMTVADGVPRGEVFEFTMSSADSKIYPGIARERGDVWHARSGRTRRS